MAESTSKQGLTRRSFLKGAAGVGGGAALASFAGAFGISTASAANDDTQTIANLAATAETLAITFYYAAITGAKFSVDAEALRYLRLAMDAEKYHLDILNSLGGKSLTQQFYVPATVLTDVNTFVKTGLAAETAFVGAYLAATRTFAEAGQGRLAATTAQHAASEFQHLTLIRDIAGLVPNDLGLPAPIYYNVSDAVPTLAPFLKGGSGFIGPVSYPTTEQFNAALAGEKTNRVPTFTMVF
ncbi:MAG TPA: ferritin-like domain-containing protein [Roseiflexaceae bacterium]|nr:ferritin-like domain-containing protein [Roseiflexaceae bacterium]